MLLTFALAAPAYAQEATPADEPPDAYHDLVRQALEESNAGRWEEARVLFRQAHEVYPNARTERGIGMVAFELRDYVDAIRHLAAALENERRPLTETQRTEVTALIERSSRFVGTYDLSAVPQGAVIIVDGHQVDTDGNTLRLAVGQHELRVRGEREWTGQWRVRGGENEPLPIVFDEPREPELHDEVLTEPALEPEDRETSAPGGAIALMIGGGALAVAGVAMLIAGLVDLSTVNDANGVEWNSIADAYDRVPILTGVGGGLIGLGGVLAVGGGIWLAVDDGGGSSAGLRMQLRGTF